MLNMTAYINEMYPCSRCIHEGDRSCCELCGTAVSPSGKVQKPSKWEAKYGKKIYDTVKVPSSLRAVIYALIADYDRRKKEIESNNLQPNIIEQYKQINTAIDLALRSIEEFYRYIIFDDIANNRGYNSSFAAQTLSWRAYHRRKRLIIATVAHYMNMI